MRERTRRRPSRRAALRGLGVVLATLLAFVLGQFEAKEHLITVFHYACPEHAWAIEDGPSAAAVAPAPGAPRLDPGVAFAAAPERAGHHSACTLPPALTQGADRIGRPPGTPPVSALGARAPCASDAVAVRRGPALLLLAPKLSPPLA